MPPIIIHSLSTTLLPRLLHLDTYTIVNNGSSWPNTITFNLYQCAVHWHLHACLHGHFAGSDQQRVTSDRSHVTTLKPDNLSYPILFFRDEGVSVMRGSTVYVFSRWGSKF